MKKIILFFLILSPMVSSTFAEKASQDTDDATSTHTPVSDNPLHNESVDDLWRYSDQHGFVGGVVT
jgi:hypothetical protein